MRNEPKTKKVRDKGGKPLNGNGFYPPPTVERAKTIPDAFFLASIIEFSEDAIVSKDLNGVITSWNRGAERIFGYSAAEAIGRPISFLIPPDHLDEERQILGRIRRGDRIEHFETVRFRKNGTTVNVSLTVSPIKDADGKIIGASKIARDITQQLRDRDRLRQSEERYRVTLASIGDAVISTDSQGRIAFMNSVAEKLTGWNQPEALGVPLKEAFKIVNEITRQPVENPVARVFRLGMVVGLANHTVLISEDGTEWPIDDSAAPIRDANGDLTGVVLVFRDATAQRTAEMTARNMAAIVENCDDAIYSTDFGGTITSWNHGAERIFGYSAAEAIGQPIAMLLPPEHSNEEPQIIDRIRQGERVEHYETTRRRKDGCDVDVSLTVSLLRDPASGRITGVSKIGRDITQRKRLEKEAAKTSEERARDLEAMVAERTVKLKQTVADLEAFSFTVSHDLRSPLRAMQGFAQALQEEYADKLDDQGRDYLARITRAAVRLDSLIREVLTFNRIGRSDLPMEPVDLETLVDEVIQTYPSIQHPHAEINVERPLLPVLGNRASLVQCVSNLLANAVKFVPPGAKATVRAWTTKEDSKVRFWVEDKGIGIPENVLSKIFEPFQRGHPHAGYEGTGMGLAIVRKSVTRMNGNVGVRSTVGQGSTFWIELPAVTN